MATKLDKADEEIHNRARKGGSATAITSPGTLSTSFVKHGVSLDLGNNPNLSAMLYWVYGAGATLTVRVKVSHDDSLYQYAPDYGAPTTGTSVASIAEITFAAATWDVDAGTTARCPVEIRLPGWRYAELWIKANAAAGTVTGTAICGTGE